MSLSIYINKQYKLYFIAIKAKGIAIKRDYNKIANLLRGLLSACDEWLVPIRDKIHRDNGDSRLLVITYSYSRISDYNPCYILFLEISLNSHFRISLFRNMWHVYSPQYKGHDDLSYSLYSFSKKYKKESFINKVQVKLGIESIPWKP